MTTRPAEKEEIRLEINKAIRNVLTTREAHEQAVAYLTRMQITLELMEQREKDGK